jgi:hypothetical protein
VVARSEGDAAKETELKQKLVSLEEKVKDNTTLDAKLQKFSDVNEKNRNINYLEGREAEKAALMAKKEKGNRDYDPFARRKTAPKHVVH